MTGCALPLPCQRAPVQRAPQGLCPPTTEVLINLRRGRMLDEGLCGAGSPGAPGHHGQGDDVMGGEHEGGRAATVRPGPERGDGSPRLRTRLG